MKHAFNYHQYTRKLGRGFLSNHRPPQASPVPPQDVKKEPKGLKAQQSGVNGKNGKHGKGRKRRPDSADQLQLPLSAEQPIDANGS